MRPSMRSLSASSIRWMCWAKKSLTPRRNFRMSTAVNEQLIRDVVAEVLGRLGPVPTTAAAPAAKAECHCTKPGTSAGSGQFGVFQEAGPACDAAAAAFTKLQQGGMAARRKVVHIIKTLAEA